MSNGPGDNATLSCTVQTYFFLRHSLHNTGNGFIWFLVFLIKSKALKEKKCFFCILLFFFWTFVFHNLYFPKLKLGAGQIWRATCSKKYLPKGKLVTFIIMNSTGGQKEKAKGGKSKPVIQEKLIPQLTRKCSLQKEKINSNA